MIRLLRVTWNYACHNFIFKVIRALKLRQIEVNIIFGWSRQNSDEMAISSALIVLLIIHIPAIPVLSPV